MSETHKIHDPFLGKTVEISSNLIDRLCGKYACGPTLPNGEPEFGWRQHETPPIQHEAAAEIDRLRTALAQRAPDTTHYLNAIRVRLETLYASAADDPRLREQLSDEVDWIDAQLSLSVTSTDGGGK